MLYNFQLIRLAGEDGVAAYGVIMYVNLIFLGVFIGYSIGSAPVVSYHFGADNRAELRGLLRRSLGILAVMSVASAFSMAGSNPAIIVFLGKPIIALAVGLILGVILMAQSGKMGEFYVLTDDTLKTVGPILFVTAAGGVLGKVIATTDLVNFITAHAATLESLGLLFPFLLAAILKTAQGSSTVAITTSAGIIAPLMMTLGFTTPLDAALVVVAIGAGAMTVSHANDSYFWVVTNFGGMEPQDGYKTQTLGTLIIGIAAIINVLIVSAIF